MYTAETIKKVMQQANEIRKDIEAKNLDTVKMCISNGNRKIGRVMNVSLMPIVTCKHCKECKWYCYDIKACAQYPQTVIDARMRNTVILQKNRKRYFAEIEKKIANRRKNKFFRWHVAGDVIDIDYLRNMVEIAARHSDFVFWTYTKEYDIVNTFVLENGGSKEKAIPQNLHIMFSEWDGQQMSNPYCFPIFTCRLKNGNKNHSFEWFENLYKCPGNCDICKACGRGCLAGENTFADEH